MGRILKIVRRVKSRERERRYGGRGVGETCSLYETVDKSIKRYLGTVVASWDIFSGDAF